MKRKKVMACIYALTLAVSLITGNTLPAFAATAEEPTELEVPSTEEQL